MVDRFNGRISEVPHTHHFDSSASLQAVINCYIWHYNHCLPQRALNHVIPIDALKKGKNKNQACSKIRLKILFTNRVLTH